MKSLPRCCGSFAVVLIALLGRPAEAEEASDSGRQCVANETAPADGQAATPEATEIVDETKAAAPEKPEPIHGVFRFTSYPVAWTAAQKTKRPILIYVTAPSCPHCVRMVEKTYKRPRVRRLVGSSFETVFVESSRQPKLVSKMRIQWFPTTIVVAPNNKVIDKIEGYVESSVFADRIRSQLAAHNALAKDAQESLVQK